MSSDKVYRSELTPVDFLRRSARVYPNKTAIVYGERRYTYAQFSERVCSPRLGSTKRRLHPRRPHRNTLAQHPGPARSPLCHPRVRRHPSTG